jgi:hypothetical protein
MRATVYGLLIDRTAKSRGEQGRLVVGVALYDLVADDNHRPVRREDSLRKRIERLLRGRNPCVDACRATELDISFCIQDVAGQGEEDRPGWAES